MLSRPETKCPGDQDETLTSNRAYGYVRISPDNDNREPHPLDVHRKKIEAWVKLNELTLVDIFIDRCAVYTPSDSRPELMKLLATIRKGETMVMLSLGCLIGPHQNYTHVYMDSLHRDYRLVAINEAMDTQSPYGRFTATMMMGIFELLDHNEAARENEERRLQNASEE